MVLCERFILFYRYGSEVDTLRVLFDKGENEVRRVKFRFRIYSRKVVKLGFYLGLFDFGFYNFNCSRIGIRVG